MGFSSAMLWWEEWQLRILVLASLFIQYLLFFSPWMRRVHALRRLRVLVWIAYIASDAVVIYALATLFNRQAQTSDGKSSSALEVLWAPFLLIHLGGHIYISAYSLEDNEIWKRHTVTLLCQVTVALYVFCKWWSGEKKLLAAAILLFVAGILKFATKPWALRTASFNNIQVCHTAPIRERMCSLDEYVHVAKERFEEYVQVAKEGRLEKVHSGSFLQGMQRGVYVFIDQSAPYSLRMDNFFSFQTLEFKCAYGMLQRILAYVFTRMYTQVVSFRGVPGLGLLFVLLPAPIVLACTLLFATSQKDGHNEKDVLVTYILFCCTTVLEFLPPCMTILSVVPCVPLLCKPFATWHVFVSQHNILSFCIRKNNPTLLMKLATFSFLREFVNQHLYIQQVPIAYQIMVTVNRHVEHCWRKYIHDAASYRRSSELRGQWAVRRHPQLGWSLKKRFDESVVIWHVATDLCFYHSNTSAQCVREETTQRSREISNYMIYLLLKRPEMLMPGTRSGLFILASENIVPDHYELLATTEENLAREILNRSRLYSEREDMISNACMLAWALMELSSEEERWTVIQGVWVEMLCSSASRCRGYLHAKSLGDGGECLTLISLLLYCMGMETYADRHHRSEIPQEEEEEPWISPSHGRPDPPQEEEEEAEPQASSSQDRSNRSAEDLSPV